MKIVGESGSGVGVGNYRGDGGLREVAGFVSGEVESGGFEEKVSRGRVKFYITDRPDEEPL